ncbi:MAG: YIP1 family protein [Candidatus Eisenbacteria bacterium]
MGDSFQDAASAAGPLVERTGPAWERRDEHGVFRGLLDTVRGSLFNPEGFFRQMRPGGGYVDPLIYAIIFGSFSMIISIVWELVLTPLRSPFLDSGYTSEQIAQLTPAIYAVTAVLSPIVVTILMFVLAGILHAILFVLGGARHGYQGTFRTLCYTQGTGLWNAVPFLGTVVGSIWYVVILVVGLREAHETPTWKAVVTVLLPLVAWLVLFILVILMVAGLKFLQTS